MTSSTTMTIRIAPEVKAKLDRIASDTKRSKSFLAGEAVTAFVEREIGIIEGIGRGIEDAAAGRLMSHSEAIEEMRGIVAQAKRGKASGR